MGSTPLETGGAPGVALELIDGLGKLGHRIDCFLPGSGAKVPARLVENDNVEFVWGRGGWRWGRWYSRTQIAAFVTGLFSRGLVSLRLRRAVARRHSQAPYDVLFQASSIESLSVPARLLRTVPLVIRPDSHQAGELRWLLAERRLALRCQPPSIFLIVAAVMTLRSFIQRFTVQRARLLICLSSVFRDHIVRDYGFPADRTVVVTNPVNLERFTADSRPLQDPPVVLVPGRVSVRKGIEDVVAVARLMSDRGDEARVRVVGGPSLWSDYTKLLEDLPASCEHVQPRRKKHVRAQARRWLLRWKPTRRSGAHDARCSWRLGRDRIVFL